MFQKLSIFELFQVKLSFSTMVLSFSIQFNSILFIHILKKKMFKNTVKFILFQVQVSFSTMVLGYFISLFLLNSIQFYFDKFQKRICLRTLSILKYFRSKCTNEFNSIKFKSITFYFIISYFKKKMFQNIVNFELFQV